MRRFARRVNFCEWKIYWKKRKWSNGFCVDEITFQDDDVKYVGNWKIAEADNSQFQRANIKDAKAIIKFYGSQIALRGVSSIDGGYGHIVIKNSKDEIVHDTWVDMYSNKTVEGLQYLSPLLPRDNYVLAFSPTQSHWYWKEKSGKKWGSKDTFVSFGKALVFK